MKKTAYSTLFRLTFGILFCLLVSGGFTESRAMGYPHRLFGKRAPKAIVVRVSKSDPKSARTMVGSKTTWDSAWGLRVPTLFQVVKASLGN